ncbi:tyrosine-protein phosphatase non-receptor type 2 isoform X1 [Hetaerina americana]|uniref:tyrosine-protein phosphatase non-receptor type 2 isoform X1 n=1 Tax=Hetaerina americana TaxID=62018 RepID=UPI003A7F3D1E
MNKDTSMRNVETEFKEIDSIGGWAHVFQRIRNECNNYEFTFTEAKKVQNKNLNRYRDVSPYDHSRVILKKGPCDYINASLIKMEKAHRQYILTQGPLPQTVGHFWIMIWEQNCKAVLMLNRVIEKDQVKCHQYWPLGGTCDSDNVMIMNDVGLKVEYVSETHSSYYTTRILRLTDLDTQDSREIFHFHYTTWPDFGVPQSPTAFLKFLMVVRESGALDENVGPPVVHCSAGIGRSGTFCLVDSCLILIEENGMNTVNVIDILLEMRKSRMGLIQTPDQLRFSYLAVIEGAKKFLDKDTIERAWVELELAEPKEKAEQEALMSKENHKELSLDKTEGNSSDEEVADEDDDAPPLPPPRGDSLARYGMTVENQQVNSIMTNHGPLPPLPPDRPLPSEPPGEAAVSADKGDSSDDEPVDAMHQNNLDSDALIPEKSGAARRRRERQERKDKTEEKVREMKRKLKDAEAWHDWKRSLIRTFTWVTVGAVIVGGGVIYFRHYWQ